MKHSIAIVPEEVVTGITEHKAGLESRISAAAARAGRDPAMVRILGVSKRQPDDRIRAAVAAGITELGENYLQEALQKIPRFGDDLSWHFIGRMQSNKTRPIAEHFHWAQTVDSARIAERLSQQRPFHAPELQVCIQVAPAGGDRGGVPPADIPALAEIVAGLPRLALRGLMVMPLPGRPPAELRAEFSAARALLDQLNDAGYQLDTLSMGMSDDLDMAVECGSTLLRIGTALFGTRENT